MDFVKLIESYFVMLFMALPLRSRFVKPSDFLNIILFMTVVIPNLSFYALNSKERIFIYYILTGYLLVVCTVRMFPKIKIKFVFKKGDKIAVSGGFLVVLFVLFLMLKNNGLRYLNFDLSKVYEYRGEVGKALFAGVLGYLNVWAFKIANPFLITWALLKHKKVFVIFFVALQVLFFGMSSHKSVLFYLFLIFGVYFLFKFINYRKISSYIVWGLFFIVVICGFAEIWGGQVLPISLFVRRALYVPALLNFAYYEVFSQSGYVYLSNSVFSFFVAYPFEYDYTRIISLYLYGHPGTNCNNGFLATSYMHFGFVGVILYSVIVGILLGLVDSLSSGRMPLWVAISFTIVPFFTLFTSADLTTSLLTHGIIIDLILLWLFGMKKNKTAVEEEK